MTDKHILVIDMDGTAIGCGADLTPEIVDFAMRTDELSHEKFAGFYVCTLRGASTFLSDMLQYCRDSIFNNPNTRNPLTLIIGNDYIEVDFQFFLGKFLHRATHAFHLATKLPILQVSIAEDVHCQHCGTAYDTLLLPHEEALIAAIDRQRATLRLTPAPGHPRPVEGEHTHKNTQLKQIARHAAALFPGHTIRLTFVDDVYQNCVSALDALDDVEGVSMRVMYFNSITREIRSINDEMSERETMERRANDNARLFHLHDEIAPPSPASDDDEPRLTLIQ